MKKKVLFKKFLVFTMCLSMLSGCCFFEDDTDYSENEQSSQSSEIQTDDDTGRDKKEDRDFQNTSDISEKSEDETNKNENSVIDQTDSNKENEPENTSGGEEKNENIKNPAAKWICSEVKKDITADMKTDPRDDFHLYVNKDWIVNNDIPDMEIKNSKYDMRESDIDKEFMNILNDETYNSELAQNIRGLYHSILDWDERNKLGMKPLENILEQIDSIESLDDLYKYITDTSEEYRNVFFDYSVGSDFENSEKKILFISDKGLNLGGAEEYQEKSFIGQLMYDQMAGKLKYALPRLSRSEDDAEKLLESSLGFEALLAERSYTTDDYYAPDFIDKILNKMTVDELCDLCPGYPMHEVLQSIGMDKTDIIDVVNPDYIRELGNIITEENLQSVKDLFTVNAICDSLADLDEESSVFCTDLSAELLGTTGMMSVEEQAYHLLRNMIPVQCQQLYSEVFGSEEKREMMTDMCKKVIDTYSDMLDENEYLSAETIEKAKEKLYAIKINSLYPDIWPDMSDYKIFGLSYFDAVKEMYRFNTKYNLDLIYKNDEEESWINSDINIMDCNAMYSSTDNSITMFLGMMGAPFYNENMSIEELYASVCGFWIGHEVSHAFDSNGSLFDKDGNYNSWWTEEDKAAYDKRTAKVKDYLASIRILDDLSLNPDMLNGEVVADFTGMECALRMASEIENFDYKKFFEFYASLNAAISTKELAEMYVGSDPHPLPFLRTNITVSQFDEFYEAYDVKEGDGMYLAPEDRILVW